MKKTTKILSLLLAMTMILSSVSAFAIADDAELVDSPNMHLTTTEPLAPADNLIPAEKEMGEIDFNDVSGHWAETVIRVLSANKYVQGNGDGTFAPENNVTRAEFIQMAINALAADVKEYDGCFSDVSADSWYANTIETAKAEGLLADGFVVDNNIKPEEAITREDAALIISAVAEKLGAESEVSAIGFVGEDEPSEYAKEGVAKAIAYGIMQGDPDGRIRPLDTLTRAEATELLTKTIELVSRLAIYVDPENGAADNKGTRAYPLASVDEAFEMAKANNDDMKNHMFVFIKGGEYYLEESINLDAEISGSNGYNIVFTSYGDERAQFMSGKHYTGFELHDENLNIYKTYVGDTMSRQVYINGVRGVRARSDRELTNAEIVKDYGYICDDTFLADYKNVKDLEMVVYAIWTQPRCGVSEIVVEDGKAKIIIDEKVWKDGLVDNTPWELPHWYENAYELLDVPGEWYIDSTDGYLYYIPRPFENPAEMVATMPLGERLLVAQGTAEEPVHNLVFEGLEFAYTTWMQPSTEMGHNDWQNNGVNGKLATPAVYVGCARYVDFINSKFEKLGASGLHMMYSIQECNVIGNEFSDISGSAFSLGDGRNGETYEKEIKPTEYKYYTINNKFNNNYVHDVAVEFASAAAVSATYPKNTQFNHNEISNSSYSGVHIGWSWETYSEEADKKGTGLYKVEVNNNYIHDTMDSPAYDGGAVYLMGGTGGTYENPSVCSNNYLSNSRNAHALLYFDSGATYWRAENNLMDSSDVKEYPFNGKKATQVAKWLQITNDTARYLVVKDSYATTKDQRVSKKYSYVEAPEIVEMDNLPSEAQAIIDNAGLEEKYLEMFPAPAQRLKVDIKKAELKSGDTIQINSEVFGRLNSVPKDDEYILYYTSSNPEVASVDENGVITANSQGRARIYVNLLIGDIIKTKEIDVMCDDQLNWVTPDELTLVKGYFKPVNPKGTSLFGKAMEIDEATYVSADENIAKVGEDGKIYGVNVGETSLKATFTTDGHSVTKEIPVRVYDFSNSDTAKLEGKPLPADFFKAENWESARTPGIPVATLSEDGKSIAVTGEASYYKKEMLKDGLYSFDLKIEKPNGWPTLAFKAPDVTKRYLNSDCYFIGICPDYFELHRFNSGGRSYFIGVESLNPSTGTDIPNYGQIFEFGKVHHITAGTIEEENGVRVILTVDGKNIYDYLDTKEGYLKGDGYFAVYAGTGIFTFSQTEK